MELLGKLGGELVDVLGTLGNAAPYIVGYVLLILMLMFIWRALHRLMTPKHDYGSLKTVTFGDESAVTSNLAASVISVVLIFLLWGAFTGSRLLPGFLHVPGPFVGVGSFDYTLQDANGATDDATVTVDVYPVGASGEKPQVAPGDGFAKNDVVTVQSYRSALLRAADNDEVTREDGAVVVAINGKPIAPGESVTTDFGRVALTPKGTLNIEPGKGWQMEPIWLPAPEAVWARWSRYPRPGSAIRHWQNTLAIRCSG